MPEIRNIPQKMRNLIVGKILKEIALERDKNGDIIIILESADGNILSIETKSPEVKARTFTKQFMKYFKDMNN